MVMSPLAVSAIAPPLPSLFLLEVSIEANVILPEFAVKVTAPPFPALPEVEEKDAFKFPVEILPELVERVIFPPLLVTSP